MAETSVTLAEETLLRVKQLEVKFAHFEADNNMTDCCLTELAPERHFNKRLPLAWGPAW